MSKIGVVGSLNVDYMIVTREIPKPGETLFGERFEMLPGGKGMNQAVCLKKLGHDVHMVGCVGNDRNGDFLLATMDGLEMDKSGVYQVDEITGCAFVSTSPQDNSIIVIKGANDLVSKEMIDEQWDALARCDLIMTQFEIPMDTVCYLIDRCAKANIALLLNPAPANHLPKGYASKIAYLTPNESEFACLYDADMETVMKQNPICLIMTAGKDGAYAHDGEKIIHVPAEPVQVVDTTGAGDAFNAGFASAIVRGKSFVEALAYANHIAAITTTFQGAQGDLKL